MDDQADTKNKKNTHALQERKDEQNLVVTSISSIIAGGVARLFCHPIDTIKAKLQVETSKLTTKDISSHLIVKIAKDTYRQEGLRGLYKGLGIATLGSAPALALYFTSYEHAKIFFRKNEALSQNENLKNFLCGLWAETVSCVLWVPIDVIKERLQVQANLKTFHYNNTFDAIAQISKVEGLSGLYRAYGATLLSYGPFSGLYLMMYEILKKKIVKSDEEVGFLKGFFLAGFAGSVASIITNPLDLAKLRMQVQRAEGYIPGSDHVAPKFGYKNIFHGIYLITQREGFLSLFKGSFARALYCTPATAISMGLLESVKAIVSKSLYHNK